MSHITRRSYTDEFKHQAVELAESLGPAAAARQLEMSVKTLANWVDAVRAGRSLTSEARRPATDLESEISRLRAENANLRMEREILKKAAASQFVQLREFDRFEAQAEKAIPLVNRRRKLPKRPMGTYKSTELDTTEKRIPWYIIALPILLVVAVVMMYVVFGRMGKRLGGEESPAVVPAANSAALRDGASATAGGAAAPVGREPIKEYVDKFLPRIPSQPWSAPVYDGALSVPSEPPRLFCMSSLGGQNGLGEHDDPSCSCVTEQGNGYDIDEPTCRYIARRGQYEPYLPRRENRFVDGPTQINRAMQEINSREQGVAIERGQRAMGTFPESPTYKTSSYLTAPVGENRL